ncbi:hypothetical protein H1R16_05620 [Marnyiella aurantia]|uniref:DUF4402 domain-containing protein n=1 Tax=Marnyiella aurantia TaxID=2758037 RepID=A0A7D7LR53_9FLAO|nr:hypothetical protein [Marnyiella aurantia]MBA5247855.1 hypothetical protein [Marnyiella aurantia]QMS99476.1 hypothetical protein H1R16_05620 [Marnyiella aurantia]
MIRIITICMLIVLSLWSGNFSAQSGSSTVLKIVLHPVQTIELGAMDQNVNLTYKTKQDYSQGVSLNRDNHLKVYSTGGYVVNVRTSDAKLKSVGTDVYINAGDITLTAAKGASSGSDSFTTAPVQLSSTDTAFITSATGTSSSSYSVTYAAKGGDAFINHHSTGQDPTVYSTEVLYSILPH